MCNYSSYYCLITCIGFGVLWFGLATLLTWQAWNKVVAYVTGWKQLSWKQVLLFLAALVVLCAPRTMLKYGRGGCDHGGDKACPYSAGKGVSPYQQPPPPLPPPAQ